MKVYFEHRRQKVLPFPEFLLRLGRFLLISSILILFSLLIGIVGYHYTGKLNLLDSFHMSCMILTGMGPVVEINTSAGKIFSSLYALYSGIAFLSISAILLSPVVHRILHIIHVENIDDSK
ncbi:MAG TPA: hypothetical protein PLX08_03110 [Bacteroidales bacterium]|jgi:hypothetical protein|nr:hypothetical protein [Bacteroidales bacterium]